jgi:hypothetical protein
MHLFGALHRVMDADHTTGLQKIRLKGIDGRGISRMIIGVESFIRLTLPGFESIR